jgi:tRNA pseudouridine55 synthase
MTEALNGVVVVDKPVGPSSFGVVSQARRLTGARKVGHGGTLDPAASGVLPICFGEATKIAQFLLDADKEYEATIRFGVATDTYDATGTVTARGAAGHLTRPQVEHAARRFQGWIEQRPPAFSALKREGRPLYELARAGQTVIVEPRRIRIDVFEVLELTADEPEHPAARVRVVCSKGTYIRSLAHDLGAALGTGAHLQALRRTRSGPFGIAQAIPPDTLGEGGAAAALVSPAEALRALPSLTLSPVLVQAVSQGKAIPWREVGTPQLGDGPVRLLDDQGALVAVATRASPEAADPGAEPLRTLRVFGRFPDQAR